MELMYEELFNKSIKDLISIIIAKDKEIEQLKALQGVSSFNEHKTILYEQKWKWLDKLVFIVKQYGRPVKSSEILKVLVNYDETAKHWHQKQKCLSVHLNKAVNYKWLLTYKVKGIRGYYYVLPEWIGNDERLLVPFKIH